MLEKHKLSLSLHSKFNSINRFLDIDSNSIDGNGSLDVVFSPQYLKFTKSDSINLSDIPNVIRKSYGFDTRNVSLKKPKFLPATLAAKENLQLLILVCNNRACFNFRIFHGDLCLHQIHLNDQKLK